MIGSKKPIKAAYLNWFYPGLNRIVFVGCVLAGVPVVSWYFRGSLILNATTLTLNTGSTLILGCRAVVSATIGPGGNSGLGPVVVLHKNGALSAYTLQAATLSGTVRGLSLTSVTAGTVIWDSSRGHQPGYDHFLATPTFSIALQTGADATTVVQGHPVNGFLQIYVQSLSTDDSGVYYCSYIDGTALDATSAGNLGYGTSGTVIINMQTKTASLENSLKSSNYIQYSIALLGASKVLL